MSPQTVPPELPRVRYYEPFKPQPFVTEMGLLPLALDQWLELDTNFPREIKLRERLLQEKREAVFGAEPAGLPGSTDLLKTTIKHLATYFPQVYELRDNRLSDRVLNRSWNLNNLIDHPLFVSGQLVQEDLCLMSYDEQLDSYRFTAGCLCFPTRWRLREKLGRDVHEIHGPVPRYESHLYKPMNKLFQRLKPERPVYRLNWTVLDNPAMHQPTGHGRIDYETRVTAQNAGETLWLRIERQTVRKLRQSGDVVFAIKLTVRPLADLKQNPEQASRLAQALRGLDDQMRRYKSMPPIIDAAIGWLETAALSVQ